ncbi:EamA family transporter [Salmonella enterica subsp. enterica serovar Infantis]
MVAALSGFCRHYTWLRHLGRVTGRYETWRVAPLSLLVPVVGLASAAVLLGETLTGMQLAGAVLIMAGLYINVFGFRVRRTARVRG